MTKMSISTLLLAGATTASAAGEGWYKVQVEGMDGVCYVNKEGTAQYAEDPSDSGMPEPSKFLLEDMQPTQPVGVTKTEDIILKKNDSMIEYRLGGKDNVGAESLHMCLKHGKILEDLSLAAKPKKEVTNSKLSLGGWYKVELKDQQACFVKRWGQKFYTPGLVGSGTFYTLNSMSPAKPFTASPQKIGICSVADDQFKKLDVRGKLFLTESWSKAKSQRCLTRQHIPAYAHCLMQCKHDDEDAFVTLNPSGERRVILKKDLDKCSVDAAILQAKKPKKTSVSMVERMRRKMGMFKDKQGSDPAASPEQPSVFSRFGSAMAKKMTRSSKKRPESGEVAVPEKSTTIEGTES